MHLNFKQDARFTTSSLSSPSSLSLAPTPMPPATDAHASYSPIELPKGDTDNCNPIRFPLSDQEALLPSKYFGPNSVSDPVGLQVKEEMDPTCSEEDSLNLSSSTLPTRMPSYKFTDSNLPTPAMSPSIRSIQMAGQTNALKV